MRLEYDILWIDNNLDEYVENGSIQSIIDFLFSKGFKANIETVYDEADIDSYLNKEYDFIISDFNLNQTTGDVLVYNFREDRNIPTEIFFYSARTNFMQDEGVKERMAFMERISFHFGRDGLMDRIENAISLTLKKLLDINATRGLITAETSELDVEIEIAFNKIIEELNKNAEIKSKIEKIFRVDYKEVSKNYLKRCKAQRNTYTNDFLEYYSKSEAFRKWDILKELLKLNTPDDFDLDLFKKYYEQVINIRNKFAHAKAGEKDGKLVLKGQYGKKDFEYDEEACVQIRKNLISHRENIKKLNG